MIRAILIAALLTLGACSGGCQYVQPEIDECAAYNGSMVRSYCYSSKEVSAARRAMAASLRDGSITLDQAKEARDVLNRADAALDMAEQLIIARQDDEAKTMLVTIREILTELK